MDIGVKTHLFKGTGIMEQLKHREFGSVLLVMRVSISLNLYS